MAKYDAITKGYISIIFLIKVGNEHYHFKEDEARRPGQRLPTSMMGNELMTKEQLYDLFQQILSVKKFEHQLLYNAMQVNIKSNF